MGENKDQQVSSKKPFSLVPYIVRTIIIVLAGSAMLPYETFLCVVLYSLYILLMSRYAFPKHEQGPEPKPKGPVFLEGRRHIMASYIKLAAYIGLYFPFAYILLGLALGQKAVVHTAAPHTFLLACQVLSERLSASLSPPCLALVPIIYNSGRIVSIWAWLQADFSSSLAAAGGSFYWVLSGRTLAIANLVLWSYNLFGFLLPLYLPFCFRKYFEQEKA
ncbi:hypothetical protein L7F22_007155 [Adiantum nelumboides]|nr:hypothetical protein [Adiantum nelumboides]MCO5553630.1 hypothetical protein [Adiantum nelumboides]